MGSLIVYIVTPVYLHQTSRYLQPGAQINTQDLLKITTPTRTQIAFFFKLQETRYRFLMEFSHLLKRKGRFLKRFASEPPIRFPITKELSFRNLETD